MACDAAGGAARRTTRRHQVKGRRLAMPSMPPRHQYQMAIALHAARLAAWRQAMLLG